MGQILLGFNRAIDLIKIAARKGFFTLSLHPPTHGLPVSNASPIETHVNCLNSRSRFHYISPYQLRRKRCVLMKYLQNYHFSVFFFFARRWNSYIKNILCDDSIRHLPAFRLFRVVRPHFTTAIYSQLTYIIKIHLILLIFSLSCD